MSYVFVGFNSLDDANEYLAQNPTQSPVTMCPGFVQNSMVVCFYQPSAPEVKPPDLSQPKPNAAVPGRKT